MNIRYRVELSQTERDELKGLLSGGRHAARKLKRAQILLAADAGASDEEIARNVGVGGSTVYRTKRRFVMGNLEAALSEEPRPGADRKLSGKEEALLVATVCSNPPKGRARWTLELLAGELVRLTEHDNISRETVRRRLLNRLEFHYVPKHASWLNMVEIEIGVLRSQCLDQRIDSKEYLVSEIAAWERQRNTSRARIKWMFTTEKARDKMGRAYPKLATKESKSL